MAGLKPSLYALVLQESRRITKAGEHSNPVTRSFYILLWCGIFLFMPEGGGRACIEAHFFGGCEWETPGDFSGGDFGQLRVRDAVPGKRAEGTSVYGGTSAHCGAGALRHGGECGIASGDVPIRCGRSMARPNAVYLRILRYNIDPINQRFSIMSFGNEKLSKQHCGASLPPGLPPGINMKTRHGAGGVGSLTK